MYDIILLTEDKYINTQETDWYTLQVLTEDRLVLEALQKKGLKASIKSWSDPTFNWSQTKTVLFRTTWDYFHRYDEFSEWLKSTSSKTVLINPASLIQWNVDKHYLNDLKAEGINIVETIFIEPGASSTLKLLHEEHQLKESVLKPTVSGGGRHTYRLNPQNLEEHETIFQELIKLEAMMLQPFQNNIVSKGEVSHMVIGGKHTHSILKLAKEGDYRVQDDFGGTVHQYTPTPEEIKFAEKAAKACSPTPVYARVDVIWDNNNELAISEIELIEPEMWFRERPEAANVLANQIHLQYFK